MDPSRTHTTSGPLARAARLLLGGGALARYVRLGSIGSVSQRALKVSEGSPQARGSASTRCTQASISGNAPAMGRCSASTLWNGSPSSDRSSRTPYFRNGKAQTSAAPKLSPISQSRPSSSAFEQVQPAAQLGAPVVQALLVGLAPRELGGHRVGRHLPDAVEPLDEDVDLGVAPGAGRPQRRVGPAGLQPAHDAHRVRNHLAVVGLQHRHEILAATARRRPTRSSGSTSIQSTGIDLWARASATRSTLVEYGIR